MSDKNLPAIADPGQSGGTGVDALDRQLLALLAANGRLSVAGLAEKAGISRAGAYTRMERLQKSGVLTGFTITVDPQKLGLGITALILVSGQQTHWRQLRERLTAMPEVEYFAFVTGEFDALLLGRAPDVETLRDVILERLQSMEDVRATQTIFVLDEVVRRPIVSHKATA